MDQPDLNQQLEAQFSKLRSSTIELLTTIQEAKALGKTTMNVPLEALESIVRSTMFLALIVDDQIFAKETK